MKWKKLCKESLDIDTQLRDAIKADPTGAALAISSFLDGLIEMGSESGLLNAIKGISDPKFSKLLWKMEREKWDEWSSEPVR